MRARCSICSAVFAVRPRGRRRARTRSGGGAATRRSATPPAPPPVPRRRRLRAPEPRALGPCGRLHRRRQPPAPAPAPAAPAPRVAPPTAAPRPASFATTGRSGQRAAAGARHRRQCPPPAMPPRRRPPRPRQPRSHRRRCRVIATVSSGGAARVAHGPRRGRLAAGQPVPVPGPRAQGAAAGPRADLRHGGVPPGQAAGGPPRRQSQGAVRGGDPEELGGVRGAGRQGRGRQHAHTSRKR